MKHSMYLTCRAFVFVALFALLGSFTSTAPAQAKATGFVYQFTAGNHVLGFQNDGVYIASTTHALRVQFLDAREVKPQAQTDAPSNRAQPLEQVTWRDLWTGISVTYRAFAQGIAESVYTIEPGASVAQIRWRYNVPAQLNADGSLTLNFDAGQMRESAPIAWQDMAGQRVPIQVAFVVENSSEIGFQVGAYDAAYPLTIDPGITWTRTLGAQSDTQGYAMALDASGFVYVAGTSNTTWGTPVNAYSTFGNDAFVAEINPTSGALVWNTFIGGIGNDSGFAIFVASGGWVYVAGTSTATWGAPLNPKGVGDEGFIAKLDAYNGALQWNTFIGGAGNDFIWSIEVDSSGYIYIGGESSATWGYPIRPFSGGTSDMFVAKYNTTGTAILWSTFLGGTGTDGHPRIALDMPRGVMYLAGRSSATWGSPLRAYNNGIDAFVAKLNMSTGALIWHTFIGGGGSDLNGGLDVDSSGNVYVVGTSSIWWGSPINPFAGAIDAFVVKMDGLGTWQWHTFMGGSTAGDYGYSLKLDASGNAYIGGASYGSWGSPLLGYSGSGDGFVAKLNAAGTLVSWNTFLGGFGADQINDLALDLNGNLFVAGYSYLPWGTPVHGFSSALNMLVAKLGSTGNLDWHTFWAGSGDDTAAGLVIGDNKLIYVVGSAYNPWDASPVRAYSGSRDAYVAKLNADGTLLAYTFLGGANYDRGNAIAITAITNNVIVTGDSNAVWSTGAFHGGTDAFVAYLDSNLVLQWVNFLGGAGNDSSSDITVITGNAIYVTGYSTATWGTPYALFHGGEDAWVAQLNFAGGLNWSTFLGGAGTDHGMAITTDSSSNLYVTGYSTATWGAPTDSFASGDDLFVAKLDRANGALLWNTFLGGTGDDWGYAILADNGAVFVSGTSKATWGSPLRAYTSGMDIVIAKLNATNGALVWHTFLGGVGEDYNTDLMLDGQGNLYTTGYSYANWGNPIFNYNTWNDGVVAKLNANGVLQWHGFMGGVGSDDCAGIAIDRVGNLFIAGTTDSAWNNGAVRQYDPILTKLNPNNVTLPIILR